jgi:hypothetical protein
MKHVLIIKAELEKSKFVFTGRTGVRVGGNSIGS